LVLVVIGTLEREETCIGKDNSLLLKKKEKEKFKNLTISNKKELKIT